MPGLPLTFPLIKNTCVCGNPTQLNLLVRPRIFFRFSREKIILCNLKGEMPFKMHKIILFSRRNNYENKCAYLRPTENFQTRYPKHTYFFIWPYSAMGKYSHPSGQVWLKDLSWPTIIQSNVCKDQENFKALI